jgi:hypothetical protein
MMATGFLRPSRLALALLAATMLTPPDRAEAAPGEPLGDEFQVNTFTSGEQIWPAVASDADGDFVIVWESAGQDGSYGGIFAQRYSAAGDPAGEEFRVNTTTAFEQILPAVAMDADGDFVVAWLGAGLETMGIHAQRYNAAGEPQGEEFQVAGPGAAGFPAVATNDAGDFVVAWTAATGEGAYEIFAKRYAAAGVAQGEAFQVSTSSADLHAEPDVAMDADGDFVVAWTRGITSYSYYYASTEYDILAKRYDAAGVAQGEEFLVNTTTAGDQVRTAVAMDAEGDFVVTWEHASEYVDIMARRFDAAGVAQGEEFRVNTEASEFALYPDVAMDADGDFVLAWMRLGVYDSYWGVESRRYNAAGLPLGGEVLVNAESVPSWFPAVAMESEGDFVIAWERINGEQTDISAQLFEGGGQPESDILWRNTGNGSSVMWQMDGFEQLAGESIVSAPTSWRIEDIGDFDGDGHADILWRNVSTGNTVIWLMDGFTRVATGSFGIVGGAWQVVGTRDFNGDGKADILWRNASNGNNLIWQMDGLTRTDVASIGVVTGGWAIEGLGDFDGDGKSDIMWRNSISGNSLIWQMDGFTKVDTASLGVVGGVWKVEDLGDFDGSGGVDILWRHTGNGTTLIWQMDGFTKVDAQSIGAVPGTWQVARVADYDGGGQADILWRQPNSGNTVIWQMSGFTVVAKESIGVVPSVWQVQ